MLKRSILPAILSLVGLGALAACDVAYPVAVMGQNGEVFRGSATNTFLYGGSFHATNGQIVCSGTYQQHADVSTVGFPVTCNNGLNGIGTAHFTNPASGVGEVRMSDGSTWQFIFGRAAAGL